VARRTERERRKVLAAYKQVKAEYIETHGCMVGLESDNHALASENDALTRQLHEMNEHTTRLLTKQAGWDKRQQELSAVIRRLKEQVRTTEATIPIGLYRDALESANEQAERAAEYGRRAAELTEQVAGLSERLIQSGAVPPPPPLPPQPPSSSRALRPKALAAPPKSPTALAHRTPAQAKLPPKNGTPTENTPPRAANAAQMQGHAAPASVRKAVSFAADAKGPPPAPTPPEPKAATPMSKIRALGGRKALEERLRRARSSPRHPPGP
jgi:hypothetical protein